MTCCYGATAHTSTTLFLAKSVLLNRSVSPMENDSSGVSELRVAVIQLPTSFALPYESLLFRASSPRVSA